MENNIIEKIENAAFVDFVRDNKNRTYAEKIKDEKYYFFKMAYNADIDFLQCVRVYCTKDNIDGAPCVTDKSEFVGIYIYSQDLLFNIEYNLRLFLNGSYYKGESKYITLSLSDYQDKFLKEVEKKLIKDILQGNFDRKAAAALIPSDDRDMKYYKEYHQRESAERKFLEGRELAAPDYLIGLLKYCSTAETLKYINAPEKTINQKVIEYKENYAAEIEKLLQRAEIEFESYAEIVNDKKHILHYQKAIRQIIEVADVKTVNITAERNGKCATVKSEAAQIGNHSDICWGLLRGDGYNEYKNIFGYQNGGDAKMNEIIKITHGKKELYNRDEFEKILNGGEKCVKKKQLIDLRIIPQ